MLKAGETSTKVIKWTVKTLVKNIRAGKVSFDLAVQRGPCWTKQQKSLLVQSIFLDWPIDPMKCLTESDSDSETTTYYFFDGQQRCLSLIEFYDNKYALSELEPFEDSDGNVVDLNGYKYVDLDVDLKAKFDAFKMDIISFENMDEEMAADAFFRQNNGKPMSSLDKNLAKAKALQKIIEVSKHPLFSEAFTEKRLKQRVGADIVTKSMMMLFHEESEKPSLDAKPMKKFLHDKDLTDANIAELNAIYDKIFEIVRDIREEDQEVNGVSSTVIYKRILGPSNIVTLTPFVKNHIEDKRLKGFLSYFFSGTERGTVSEEFNGAAGAGTGHAENVAKRQHALESEWKKAMVVK